VGARVQYIGNILAWRGYEGVVQGYDDGVVVVKFDELPLMEGLKARSLMLMPEPSEVFAAGLKAHAERAQAEPEDGSALAPDPRFPQGGQSVFVINDDALNRRGLERRMLALVVDREVFEAESGRVRDGLVVVTKRTRDDGASVEIAARLVKELSDHTEFQPDSTNLKHKSYRLPEAEVVGVVIAAVRPLLP
jgi:hypothetical protein